MHAFLYATTVARYDEGIFATSHNGTTGERGWFNRLVCVQLDCRVLSIILYTVQRRQTEGRIFVSEAVS